MKRLESPSFCKELERYCDRLRAMHSDSTVILSGSTAVGEEMPWSDVDLIVIADFNKPFLQRLEELAPPIDMRLNLEVAGYTLEEFMAMLDQLNIKAIEAVEHGVPIITSPIVAKLKAKLTELKRRGLTKTRCTYTLTNAE